MSPINDLLSHASNSSPWPSDLSEGGQAKPEWQHLLQAIRHLGPQELQAISRYVSENIQTRGLIHNAYTDPQREDSWRELSSLPYVISEQEWELIEQACEQRAILLNRILQDIYGPQELVRQCLIPPSLVYGQRGYLWPCHNALGEQDRYLSLYAMDIARTPEGQWVVLKDRTDCPMGIGYAIQNRQVQGAALVDVFQQMNVKPQTEFYRSLRAQLQGAKFAQEEQLDQASIVAVLLSSGPLDPAYFEQLFLSRQMGITLAESADLTVRNEEVFLKTLNGLQRVHIILRYVNDGDSDPMELGGVDFQGVPSLLQAIRQRKVLMLNALGCGVLESAGMLEFLPAINQYYFEQDLLLPSVRSWWCGDPDNLSYVLENFSRLMIKSSYASQSQKYWYVPDMSEVEQAELRQRIVDSPRTFVANEVIQTSRVPEFVDETSTRLAMYPFTLRIYAVARPEGGYQVMAGGVARISSATSPVMTLKNRHANKDIWVCQDCHTATVPNLANAAVAKPRIGAKFSELSHVAPLNYQELLRRQTNVPSRMGENLFWLGRYAMRIEYSLLLLRTLMKVLNERTTEQDDLGRTLYQLASSLGILPVVPAATSAKAVLPFIHEQVKRCLEPSSAPNSLNRNVMSLHHCAFQVREKLSNDAWWLLSQLPTWLVTDEHNLSHVSNQIQQLYSASSVLSGFTHEQMTRDGGWNFLLMGRIIEKLTRLCDTMQFFLHSTNEQKQDQLESLLQIAYSSVTYRSRYHREAEILAVMYLLIFDETNPYSLVFLARQFLNHSTHFELPSMSDIDLVEQVLEHFSLIDLSYFDAQSPRAQTVYAQLAKQCSDLSVAMAGFTAKLSGQYFLMNDRVAGGFGKDSMNKEYL